jgi:hypothetical protein
MKKELLLICLVSVCSSRALLYSQEPCKVLKPEIAEKYQGGCKDGMANGKGVAEGKDKYEGGFRNGLPHGEGEYTWANGDVFDGVWVDGKREGEGRFFYKMNGVDSVKVEIWENDSFIKTIPYKVLKANPTVNYTIRKIGAGNRVLFSIRDGLRVLPELSFGQNSGNAYSIGNKKGFDNITFPFSCRLSCSVGYLPIATKINDFEIEITQPGTWEISFDI